MLNISQYSTYTNFYEEAGFTRTIEWRDAEWCSGRYRNGQGLFILSSFPPLVIPAQALVIPAQAGIYIVLPRESCHRPL